MIVHCVKCKKEFERKRYEKKCEECARDSARWGIWWTQTFSKLFQDPIYQWRYEFVTTEKLAGKEANLYYGDWT